MSSLPVAKITPPLSPKIKADVELVEKLLQKTQEKKLSWSKADNRYHAETPDGTLSVNLLTQPNVVYGSPWFLFEVKSGSEELLKVEPNNTFLTLLAGSASHPLSAVIGELFEYLEGARSREVRKAIGLLDRL